MLQINTNTCISRLVQIMLSLPTFLFAIPAFAQTFTSGDEGAEENITVGGTSDLWATMENILFAVIKFMGLAAVIVIVIAGIMLVVGAGSDESRQKTIKIVIYSLVGLIVIGLASAFVTFIISTASGSA